MAKNEKSERGKQIPFFDKREPDKLYIDGVLSI